MILASLANDEGELNEGIYGREHLAQTPLTIPAKVRHEWIQCFRNGYCVVVMLGWKLAGDGLQTISVRSMGAFFGVSIAASGEVFGRSGRWFAFISGLWRHLLR